MTRVQPASSPAWRAGTLLLCSLLLAAPGRGSDSTVLQLPIEVPLDGMTQQLERMLPVQRHQGQWQRHRGVDVSYRIWRGPLALHAAGDRLHLGADIGYWIRARKKLLGPLKVSGSCGLHEPPRFARLHVSSRLSWGKDWRVHTQSQVHPNYFANPCRLTRARIDVTPLIDRYLNRTMNQVLRTQVEHLIAQRSDLREHAASLWQTLQRPLQIDADAWLVLQPEAIHAAPFKAGADRLTTALGIRMQPRVVFGPAPEVPLLALPELAPAPLPAQPRLDLSLAIAMPLQYLRDSLVHEADRRLSRVGAADIDLVHTRLDLDQGELVVRLAPLRLRLTPVLDRQRQRPALAAAQLEPDIAPTPAGNGISHPRLLTLLNELLDRWYDGRVQALRDRLDSALNRTLHPRIRLQGQIDAVRPVALDLRADSVHIELQLLGRVRAILQ